MKITASQRKTLLLMLACLSFGSVPAAHAIQAVALAWNASPSASVAGYTISYGTSVSSLNLSVDAGNNLSVTIQNLADGQTYFFVATAYTSSGLFSAPSNMIVYTTAAGAAPSPASQSPVSSPNSASGSFIGYSGDFSGNGKQDILWRNMQTGEVDVWFMDGASVVSQVSLGAVSLNWQIVGTADFTGDGRSDILWQNTTDGSFGIWVMNGSNYTGYGFPSQGSEWAIVGVANLDHAGPGTIFWRNVATGELVVWTGNAGLNFSSAYIGAATLDWILEGTADITGSGQSALIWRNQNSGQVVAWQLNQNAITGESALGTVPFTWNIVGFGDFSGSGRQGMLWRSATDGSVVAWLMNGSSISPAWVTQGSMSLDWQITGTPDVVGNGANSILWSNATTGQQVIWIPGGAGFSQASIGFAAPPWAVQ